MSESGFACNVSSSALSSCAETHYAYTPTKYVCIIFLTLFSLSTALHIGQAFFYRLWWLLPTVCFAGWLEVLGWSGRFWSSHNVTLSTPLMISICTSIIGPTPLLAANFAIVERIIRRLGTSYSRLSPMSYMIVFSLCDCVSLVVQGVGCGLASTANTPSGARMGANVMLGGIVFQLCAFLMFTCFTTEFFIRYLHGAPLERSDGLLEKNETITKREPLTRKLKLILIAVVFNSTCLFIRAIYRTIALSGGWHGRVISTEVYFNVLDGGMIILAIFTMNLAHPGFLLRIPKLDT